MAEDFPSELSSLLGATDAAARDAAWPAFLDHYSRLLLHVTRRVCRQYDTAMDAYAHILEQLRADDCRRLRAFAGDGRCKFTTWLVIVAQRLCLDHMRSRYGRLREQGDDARERLVERRRLEDLLPEQVDPEGLADEAVGPEAELIATEQANLVTTALARLAPADRLLLRLRFEEELSAPEIAALLHFPTPFHVYRRVRTLLAVLREELTPRSRRQEQALPPSNRASER